MVLLAAALYTVYQQQQQQQQREQNGGDASDNNSPNNSKQQALQDLSTAVQGQATQLYQTAVLRCTSSHSSTSGFSRSHHHNNNSMTAAMMHHHHQHLDEEDAPSASTTTTTANSSTSTTTDANNNTTLDPVVRQEWWNAVYGPDFLPLDNTMSSPPLHGTGLAQIPSYTAVTATIPASSITNAAAAPSSASASAQSSPASGNHNNKLGVTISRLPLGLYVQAVAPRSEAALTGVPLKSVLVSINGLSLLAEASRPALERLWHYEGYFSSAHAETTTAPNNRLEQQIPLDNTNASRHHNNNNNNHHPSNEVGIKQQQQRSDLHVRQPVTLQFIRNGQLFSVTLLSNPPWGISWAPCGNFPLVKRVYGAAHAAGVPRGSLVAAVNGLSCREMDHAETALRIQDLVQGSDDDDITLVLVVPPKQARASGSADNAAVGSSNASVAATSNSKAGSASSSSPRSLGSAGSKPTSKTVVDGVEVKFHSWEQALGSLVCSPLQTTTSKLTGSQTASPQHEPLHRLADQVTAGMVVDQSHHELQQQQQQPHSSSSNHLVVAVAPAPFGPCPTAAWFSNNNTTSTASTWDPVTCLLNDCLELYATGFDGPQVLPADAPLATRLERLRVLLKQHPRAAYSFVLQFLSIICMPPPAANEYEDEKKQAEDDAAAPTTSSNNNNMVGSELTSLLLKLSRRDEGFCQYLYFLLRSFISTLETTTTRTNKRRSSLNNAGAAATASSNGTNLMALLHCLELLRFAEKELAGRPLHVGQQSSLSPTMQQHMTNNTIEQPYAMAAPGRVRSILSLDDSAASSSNHMDHPAGGATSPESSGHPDDHEEVAEAALPPQQQQGKSKRMLGFFRKKKSSNNTTKRTLLCRSVSASDTRSPTAGDVVTTSPKQNNSGKGGPLSMKRTKSADLPRNNSGRSMDQQQQLSVQQHQSGEFSSTMIAPSLSQSPSTMYENMSDFLSELDRICSTIERSLQKSVRQKIAEWALQPWSASKDSALAQVTASMRRSLRQAAEESISPSSPSSGSGNDGMMQLLVNPVDSSELLSGVDYEECYILPSAHFPILLTFNVSERGRGRPASPPRLAVDTNHASATSSDELLYRTTVELVSLKGAGTLHNSSYVVHAAVAGSVAQSGPTLTDHRLEHKWSRSNNNNLLHFETRSSWGAPQTLSLRLSANTEVVDQRVRIDSPSEIGYCWVDLSQNWQQCDRRMSYSTTEVTTQVWTLDSSENNSVFDEQGQPSEQSSSSDGDGAGGTIHLQLRIRTERVAFDGSDATGTNCRKRMLLYKHDDDLRQEAFAVQFIRTCDDILKAAGLDMRLLTFQCIPVGTRRGFVEWVPGSIPLSEICQPFAGSLLGDNSNHGRGAAGFVSDSNGDSSTPSMLAKAGLHTYESLARLSQRRLGDGGDVAASQSMVNNNPVQDYLRSVAYDQDAPYMIRKEVMDTYVKSVAGYCVITYILGVGDRHLDNLLLHQSGSFFHCDFSFILGQDPKKYLPMRITEDMVRGMGGRESDNYAKFMSLTGAAFLALRHAESVRVLLSMVRLMESALLPDVSENQSIQEAIFGMRNRLRLDLTEEQALNFMEELVESSLSSKMWMAVDAIHNLGKKMKL